MTAKLKPSQIERIYKQTKQLSLANLTKKRGDIYTVMRYRDDVETGPTIDKSVSDFFTNVKREAKKLVAITEQIQSEIDKIPSKTTAQKKTRNKK